MLSIFMNPEATSSQTGEATQLAEFPWRFLPSMLSEFMYYKHFALSARVITFDKLFYLRLCFTPLCIIRVSFLVLSKHCFLQLFVTSVEVHSQSILFDTYILASVTIKGYIIHTLLYLCLCQRILKVSLLEHLYPH